MVTELQPRASTVRQPEESTFGLRYSTEPSSIVSVLRIVDPFCTSAATVGSEIVI